MKTGMIDLRVSIDGDTSMYERNLAALQRYHPSAVMKIRDASSRIDIGVILSKSGHPVPVLNGTLLHSADDPVMDGEMAAQQAYAEFLPEKIVFFGFGFGYGIFPFLTRGMSPIVYEPSPELMKFILHHVDFTPFAAYVVLHVGSRVPDLPRSTQVFITDAMATLFPEHASALSRKMIDHIPPKTGDMEEGVYYETYRNVTCLKNPCDLVAYQMLIHLIRPTVILEIGTCRGGSALLFADILQSMGGERRVHTFDVVDEAAPELLDHPNVTFHPGGWQVFDPAVLRPEDRVLITEDSAHDYENTIRVLNHFADYVSPNSYFIVEDGAAGLVRPNLNGGAIRAIEEFLAKDRRFEVDSRWETFFGRGNSGCLKGFLRRKPEPN